MLASYKIPNANEHPATCSKNGQVRDIVPDEILEQIYKRYPKGTNGYLLLKICEHTGMRLCEAAALCFEDVDFEDRKIYVTRVHRGLEAKSADISITDNKTFEAYLKSLDRDGLKHAMDAVYAQLAAST